MRIKTFVHECEEMVPQGDWGLLPPEECGSEVILEYEVGKSREDFILMENGDIKCGLGHVQTRAQLDKWFDHDEREMGEIERERYEAAYDNYINSLIDKARGK